MTQVNFFKRFCSFEFYGGLEMTKQFYIEEIGNVRVTKYRHSKKIKIAVNAKKEVKVSIPYFVSYSKGIGFVRDKIPWIIQTRDKMKSHHENMHIRPDFKTRVLGKVLILQPAPVAVIKINAVDDESIVLQYPEHMDFNHPEIQYYLKSSITEVLRMEAKRYLPQRVKELAARHGFVYARVFVKNLKSRWGSCSSRNNINLNLHLLRLPSHLIDYVILHELVHTKHRNHGVHFWNALNKVLQTEAKSLQKEMRKYHPDFVTNPQV